MKVEKLFLHAGHARNRDIALRIESNKAIEVVVSSQTDVELTPTLQNSAGNVDGIVPNSLQPAGPPT
jgi:hypothetical protein